MQRSYHQWHSPVLNRQMELLVFGHAGARVVVFPTSKGRFYDYEDRGMVGAVWEHLEQGWIQLFCLDSVDAESWYATWKPQSERLQRQEQYEAYILNEVLPFSQSLNGTPFLITTGNSFGAFHAINFALRHPTVVDRAIGLSGLYDLSNFMGGYGGDDFYFFNPVWYMEGTHDQEHLNAIRHMDLIFAVGWQDPAYPSNQRLSDILWSKGVGHAFRPWDGWAHDWPYWQQMILQYLPGTR